MKINDFQGELTDISAKKEALILLRAHKLLLKVTSLYLTRFVTDFKHPTVMSMSFNKGN